MPGMISTATGSVSVDPTAESLLHHLGKGSFVCFVSLLLLLLLPVLIVRPSSAGAPAWCFGLLLGNSIFVYARIANVK
jgi:hypothetical protein